MTTLFIRDKKTNFITPINVDITKSDLAVHVLIAYAQEILYIQKIDALHNVSINATERVAKLINSMLCFGWIGDEIEITNEKDEILRVSKEGACLFERRQIKAESPFLIWLKTVINKYKKKQPMATFYNK
jgi:hypothetical protein